MKKNFLVVFLLLCTVTAFAETLKMKDGTLISGSILSQTEYTLNLATSYGNITLNQREIEQILPDKHRLILKGGTQLVGIILDMDEFNLKLQTDDGATVNVDMPQIVSIEAYDYDMGKNAQQEFVEHKIEQQTAAQAAAAQQQTQHTASTVEAAGGLTFDSDIDQVFDAKKATVVNGQVQTPAAQVKTVSPQPLTDEEAFLKGVKSGAISPQEVAAAAKKELSEKKPKKEKKPTDRPLEKNTSKYFAVQAGVMPLDLKLDNTSRVPTQTELIDVGGTSAVVSAKFLWRVKESNLWLGPTAYLGNIANNSFPDLSTPMDPTITDPTVTTSGRFMALGAAANYYLTPSSPVSFYLTTSANYEMLTLNYRGEMSSSSISSNGLAGAVGAGLETWVDDLMLGLEVRQSFAPRSKDLKKSASSNTIIQAQLSWKF